MPDYVKIPTDAALAGMLRDGIGTLPESCVGMTVSAGTLLPSHLLDTFWQVLQAADMSGHVRFDGRHFDAAAAQVDYPTDADAADRVAGVMTDMFDLLDSIAPEGCYFGSLEGDGACFGFWQLDADDAEGQV